MYRLFWITLKQANHYRRMDSLSGLRATWSNHVAMNENRLFVSNQQGSQLLTCRTVTCDANSEPPCPSKTSPVFTSVTSNRESTIWAWSLQPHAQRLCMLWKPPLEPAPHSSKAVQEPWSAFQWHSRAIDPTVLCRCGFNFGDPCTGPHIGVIVRPVGWPGRESAKIMVTFFS